MYAGLCQRDESQGKATLTGNTGWSVSWSCIYYAGTGIWKTAAWFN